MHFGQIGFLQTTHTSVASSLACFGHSCASLAPSAPAEGEATPSSGAARCNPRLGPPSSDGAGGATSTFARCTVILALGAGALAGAGSAGAAGGVTGFAGVPICTFIRGVTPVD